jgi:hypothetical protein
MNIMKLKLLSIIIVALVFAACSEKQQSFSVSNVSDIDLTEKSIVIKRADLEAKYGELKEQALVFIVDETGEKLLAQLDDTRGNGKWDEMFAQVNLKAGETRTFTIEWGSPADFANVEGRTNIRFADKSDPSKELERADRLTTNDTETSQAAFQFEGPGWENDVVGFRNYFDARNGMDIWGKKTSEIVLDKVGLKGAPSYHEMQDWGMDILKVGNSLGAGGIALLSAGQLYRVGPGSVGKYKLITEGPLRSIFELQFDRINIAGRLISVQHSVAIEAGKPYYNNFVFVDDAGDAKLAPGIVNMDTDNVYTQTSDKVSYFYTHGNQAYDGEVLGMAIIAPVNNMVVETAPDSGDGVIQTYYTVFDIASQIEYYFMAGWELQNPAYSSLEGFEKELDKQAKQLVAKVKVEI